MHPLYSDDQRSNPAEDLFLLGKDRNKLKLGWDGPTFKSLSGCCDDYLKGLQDQLIDCKNNLSF